MAGWEKVTNPAWFGGDAGAAMQGFVQGALGKTTGLHPDVQMWYAAFLKGAVLPTRHVVQRHCRRRTTRWARAIVDSLLVSLHSSASL